MPSIARELESARQSLLDLTLRNRLLNYRPSQQRSIRVIGELPAEIYDALVLREKALDFRAAKKGEGITDGSQMWVARNAAALEATHTDRYLQTPYDEESLGKKLFRVYHEGRSAVEEQGYTVAHLAIGFLEWFESEDSEQPRRAPLLLVPAELDRVRAGDFSRVRWTGEDVFANISLVAKLVEYGVALPPFEPPEEKSGIDAWLAHVVDAIAKKPRWRVLSELTLDFFSFTKFVMFKDLDPATWPHDRKPHDHPLIQTLFHPSGTNDDRGFDEKTIDEKLTGRDLWHVMDADPSQIAVVEDVKAGRNLVVEGPPGTGKSQTITNLIAEALAANRTVLFVSEKMAALEVVKSRLDAAGLGPFCLELHSRKSNKKAVLQELQHALGSKPLAALSEQLLDEHELLKRDLNRYAFELGTPVGRYRRTPYQLFGMREAALAQLEETPPLVRIDDALRVTESDVVATEKALRDLAYIVPLVHPATSHPWHASSREAMLPHDEAELRSLLANARDAARDAIAAAAALAESAGVQQPSKIADIERSVRAAEVLARVDGPIESMILLSGEWNAANPVAEEMVRRVESLQRDRAELLRTFSEVALEANSGPDLDEFAALSVKFFRFFNGRYRALRRQLADMYVTPAPKPPQMIADLSRLVEFQSTRDALRGDARGRGYFGARWKADRSDCVALRGFANWIVTFRRELLAQVLTQKAVDLATARIDADMIRMRIDRVRTSANTLRDAVHAVLDEVDIDQPIDDLQFTAIDELLEQWQSQTAALFHWSQFNAGRKTLRATAAAALDPLVASDTLPADRLAPFFRASLAESLLRITFGERASLGHFAGDLHEKKIARFRELDESLVPLNRARLSRKLHASRPQLSGGASRNSEAGVLLGELNRKRGHMPIRKLLSAAGGVIQRIKPCFLMSPLSIAQFLDPRSARFDLIVFDEASQVRPEDAVGALLRGSQLVVMGDTKQLPPTSFFDHLGAGDDDEAEDESAALKDVESILHQCARSYPSKTLNWHYRSRHESLIAMSNYLSYEGRLRIYPSPIDRAHDLGLQFVHVPHGVYDRGRNNSGVNRVEAQLVAAAAIDHYRRNTGKSLGIGTFNVKQQQAIQEEVELQLRVHPEMEEPFRANQREPFFVKNLETIQGDERDVILISVGYGRDAQGKLSMNFGPINKEGGERRLNVLISRAREKCVVYSNFRGADLSLDNTNAKGVFALKTFLDYAESRCVTLGERVDDEDDASFENAVAEVLRANGWEVRQRIGVDESRVDIAVVDPQESGRYLLGVQCDGAKYHGSPVARDRDRLRQQVLENLGWTIHRVWSTDWYRARGETIARLLQTVEEAKNAPRKVVEPFVTIQPIAEVEEVIVGSPVDETHEYEVCRSLRIPIIEELHLVSAADLAVAVEDVVTVEGPVHVDEVIRRLRTLWGLQRAGNRIRDAIGNAVRIAIAQRRIEAEGDFLRVPNAAIRVRRRNGDPPARIDYIADAEIQAALEQVLRAQFATQRDELVSAAARRFGIQATSDVTASLIESVLNGAIARGVLTEKDDVIDVR